MHGGLGGGKISRREDNKEWKCGSEMSTVHRHGISQRMAVKKDFEVRIEYDWYWSI